MDLEIKALKDLLENLNVIPEMEQEGGLDAILGEGDPDAMAIEIMAKKKKPLEELE